MQYFLHHSGLFNFCTVANSGRSPDIKSPEMKMSSEGTYLVDRCDVTATLIRIENISAFMKHLTPTYLTSPALIIFQLTHIKIVFLKFLNEVLTTTKYIYNCFPKYSDMSEPYFIVSLYCTIILYNVTSHRN